MAQHALGREDDEGLTPCAAHLAAQHVEVLRGGRRLANLHVVFSGELHKALHARAGMLRSLALVAMRQKQHYPGRKIPLVFACADELVDDHLRAVCKIAELRFPQNERLRIVAAEPVFEAKAARLGKRGVVDFAKRLVLRKVAERKVIVLGYGVNQNGVALVEGAALRILPGEADGIAFQDDGSERQRLREPVVNGALSAAHFRALFEQLHDLRMNMKADRKSTRLNSSHSQIS